MTRLADIVIIRIIRAWAEAQKGVTSGWLGAIRDPRIGKALAAFHDEPSKAWSVESLAAAAHLSRSVFSERFASALGVPPARYVALSRMQLAGRWLNSERVSVSEAASRLGYHDEASFSRAFKRIMGAPPSAFHRERRAPRSSL